MNDRNVHADIHPTGQPNRTAVNADNPIFGRPADPIPEVSMQQAAIVQSEKTPRETVQSPLINEAVASSMLPSAGDLDAVAADPSLILPDALLAHANSLKADDWTQTNGAGLTDDTTSAETGAEYTHSSGLDSSKITGVEPVALPTQEEADAAVAQAQAEQAERKEQAASEG